MKTLVKLSLMLGMLAASALSRAVDTINASVNARAGVSPVLSLICTDVNFGVWRVPVRAGGSATTITLTVSANTALGATTATVNGQAAWVAIASGYQVPDAALCTVAGATNRSATIQTAISNNNGLTFGASNHNNLGNPVQVASLSANLTLGGAGVAINNNGDGTFRVVGVLSIPATIAVNNYGGYKTQTGGADGAGNAASVTVTDAI